MLTANHMEMLGDRPTSDEIGPLFEILKLGQEALAKCIDLKMELLEL